MNSLSTSKALSPHPPLLEGLTPEQREAVLSRGGPLLVLAGAGTGKTRVIAHRIAHLIRSIPGLIPSNILALAFSRKAAEELRQRVESLLGSHAESLEVFTFHSFCHRFLQDHALELGLPMRFQLLDSVESWIFFRKILPDLKLRHHANLSDPVACIEGFLRFISRAKDELVSPADYAQYVEGLSDRQERARGEEVARVYRIYQAKMRESGNLDFGDLIVETHRALREKPAFLEEFTAQYRYILVDEFQDTNVAQIHLLTELAKDSGNLTVVGDDDQAIYRFRGASFASFLLMKQAFPKVQTLRLARNYRSTQKILSVAERLIRHNEPDRYDPEKSIWTENPEGPPVSVVVCPNTQGEAAAVVEGIRRICQSEPTTPLGSIAVLYRAHAHRNHVVEELSNAQIPFWVEKGTALFDLNVIQELIALLTVLHDPSDSVEFFRVLSHPIWGIPLQDLVTLTRRAREKEASLREVLLEADPSMPLQTRQTLSQFLKEFNALHRRSLREGLQLLIPHIVQESSWRLLFRLPADRPEEASPLMALGRFLRYVNRYVQTHPDATDLKSFLWHVDSTLLSGGNPSDDEEENVGNRVRLMTIHQAKGLEFDWVILLGMVQGRFPGRSHPEMIPFSETLMKEPLPQGDFHLQEERRLCYVACTRARRGLILMTQEHSRHRPSLFVHQMTQGASEKEVERCRLADFDSKRGAPLDSPKASLALERELLDLFKTIRQMDPGDQKGFSTAVSRMRDLAGRLHQEKTQTSSLTTPVWFPKPERFSFTQLETYRFCPMKYKYSYLYQIPVGPTPDMSFGVDLHGCLESFFKAVMKGEVPSCEDLLDSFRCRHLPGRYGETAQDQGYQRLGLELLKAFYKSQGPAFPTPLLIEKPFHLRLEGACAPEAAADIRGVVDRVDRLPEGGVEVIDYKSGRPKQKAPPDERLQLRLYALACREVFELVPKKVSFYYLRTNEKLSFDQNPEDFEETKGRILELVGQIRSGDFTPDPSSVKCRRCDFRNLCPASLA